MAVIYSYPSATPTASDLVLGTATSDASGENPTKTFSIGDIIGLVPAAGTGGTVTRVKLINTDGFVTITNPEVTTAGDITVDLTNNGGTPNNTTYYRGDGKWEVPPNTVPYTYTLTSTNNGPAVDVILTDNLAGETRVKLTSGAGISMASTNNDITVTNTGVNSVVGSTFITVDSSTATAPIVSLANNTTTPDATKFYRGDGTWQTIAAGGTMSSWTLLGDTGTENIVEAESVKIQGNTGVSVAVADNGGVAEATISLDSAVPTSVVAGSNIQVSGTGAVTVASANSVQNSPNPVPTPDVTQITNIVALKQAQYNALTPVDTHLYIITN